MYNGKIFVFFRNEFTKLLSLRDEAIELADRALTMTKDERIEEFTDLLKDVLDQSKTGKKNILHDNFLF